MDTEEKKPKKIKVRSHIHDITKDFSKERKLKSSSRDIEMKRKLKPVLHRGMREYREKNYFRAIHEFELALMMSPGNARAAFYLDKTKQGLDGEIEQNFLKAKRDTSSLKYQSAIISYCAIVKLLEAYPEDSRYKDAYENIKFVEKKMGLDEGETNCS